MYLTRSSMKAKKKKLKMRKISLQNRIIEKKLGTYISIDMLT